MLKSAIRSAVREDRWRFLEWYRERHGLWPALGRYPRLLAPDGLARVPVPALGSTILLRPGTADQRIFDDVFVGGELALDFGAPSFIVDAGAHIGIASVYLAHRFPEATIAALEPDPGNFAILCRNVSRLRNVRPLQAGLWKRTAALRIVNPEVASWAFHVEEDPTGRGIPAVDVLTLLTMHGASRIDLLKIDIEGSEIPVFDGADAWLDRVGSIAIELHDAWYPGCTDAVARALHGFEYDVAVLGEKRVFRNLRRHRRVAGSG